MLFGKHINKYYLRYGYMLLLGVVTLAAVDYAQLLIPEIYGSVIDGLDPSTPFTLSPEILIGYCYRMFIIAAVMIVGRFLWRICFFGSAIKVEAGLRREMFDRCRFLSQHYFQENKVGGLMSLYTNDLETINECYGDGVLMFFDALILGVFAVFKMLRMNALLTLFALIPMALLCAIGSVVGKYMQKKWEERQESFSALSDFAQESFSGIAVIKAFVREAAELSAFASKNRHNEKVNVVYTKASVLLNVLVTLFVQSVICVILGYGGWLAVSEKQFSASQLVVFVSYFTSIVWPVMAVSMLIEMHSRGKASLKRISELLDELPEVRDAEGAVEPESVSGAIEFRNLSFRYPDGEFDVLSDVSFKVEQGEHIGVIGRTGAGKTTLADLLLRAYNVPDGKIFIDGTDINRLSLHALRSNISYVPQDNFLFSDTIGHNIAFATGGEASPEAIRRAASLAAVDDNIVSFQDGYDTMLGERGVTISGGQKQRTSIARAFMKKAPVMILDDAVSAVDTGTEKEILDHIDETCREQTVFLIAHRVTTVERMDRIAYFSDGRLEDIGTHDELCERCEDYRRLVELQRLEDEIGVKNA